MTSTAKEVATNVASNVVVTALMRGVVLLGVPLLLGLASWLLATVLTIKDEQTKQSGKIELLESRFNGRITAVEDRQSAQSRRMDITDTRIDRMSELATKFSIDVAVLAVEIRRLIEANQGRPAGSAR